MLIIKQPGSVESPDSTQSGIAVTNPTVTGHDSTSASVIGSAGLQTKSCRWFTFPAGPGGQISSITLKVTHTSSGALSGIDKHNTFRFQYSLDNGGAWTTAVSRSDFTASEGPTVFSVALPTSQDLTLVQVRDFLQANTLPSGGNATATATISDIQIEVVAVEAGLVQMW